MPHFLKNPNRIWVELPALHVHFICVVLKCQQRTCLVEYKLKHSIHVYIMIFLSHLFPQRQAAEIVSLQQKMTQSETTHQKAEGRWESERTSRETRHEQHMTGLQNDLITLREKHTQEVRAQVLSLFKDRPWWLER